MHTTRHAIKTSTVNDKSLAIKTSIVKDESLV